MQPDLVLDNANVLTVDPTRPRAGSIAIVGDRIVGVGDVGEFDGAQRTDLGGRTLVPGFNDAHNHMGGYGAALNEVPLHPDRVRSTEEIVAAIAARVADVPAGVWVIGTGYDDNKLDERRHPTRRELDAVSPDNPVLLNHLSLIHI